MAIILHLIGLKAVFIISIAIFYVVIGDFGGNIGKLIK